MKTEELKALLEAELAEAELHYIKCRKAYDTFIKANKTPNFKFPAVDGEKKRENLKQLVTDAVKSFPAYEPFTTVDIFKAMNRDDLVYENVRPRISKWLSTFADEYFLGLKKKSRGTFVRSMRRTK